MNFNTENYIYIFYRLNYDLNWIKKIEIYIDSRGRKRIIIFFIPYII